MNKEIPNCDTSQAAKKSPRFGGTGFLKEFNYPASDHILGHFRDLSTHQHVTVEWLLEGVETKLNPLNTYTGSAEQLIIGLDECVSTV